MLDSVFFNREFPLQNREKGAKLGLLYDLSGSENGNFVVFCVAFFAVSFRNVAYIV